MRQTNTGFKGITRRTGNSSNYEATVNIQGRRVFHKGTKTLQEAVEARNNYILSLL